jgi:hypothetical protein
VGLWGYMLIDVGVISIGPPHIYKELVQGLALSLKELYYNPIIRYHQHSGNDIIYSSPFKINIIITGRSFKPNNNHINILVETEQNHIRRDPELPEQYSNYTKVLQIFKEQEVMSPNSVYFPIGYSDAFSSTISNDSKSYDVSHFGQVIPEWRRSRLIDKFNVHNINSFGELRDVVIQNSKINVIFKKHEEYYFTPIHALLIICKGKFLLQEQCKEYGIYKNCLIEFTEDTYLDTIKYWLENRKHRIDFGYKAMDYLRSQHSLTKYLKEAWYGI